MKLQACNREDVGRLRTYSVSENRRLLEEFANSGLECAKVTDFTHRDAYVCANALRNSIRTYRMFSYTAVVRGGEVYLLRKTDK